MSRRHWLMGAGGAALAITCAVLPAAGAAAQPPAPIAITSPADGETVHDNPGNVRVTLSIQAAAGTPALRPLVDGKPHGPDRRTTAFVLEGVDRGQHVLQVLLLDAGGKAIAASQPVTFHVWRASARSPGRTLRP